MWLRRSRGNNCFINRRTDSAIHTAVVTRGWMHDYCCLVESCKIPDFHGEIDHMVLHFNLMTLTFCMFITHRKKKNSNKMPPPQKKLIWSSTTQSKTQIWSEFCSENQGKRVLISPNQLFSLSIQNIRGAWSLSIYLCRFFLFYIDEYMNEDNEL